MSDFPRAFSDSDFHRVMTVIHLSLHPPKLYSGEVNNLTVKSAAHDVDIGKNSDDLRKLERQRAEENSIGFCVIECHN